MYRTTERLCCMIQTKLVVISSSRLSHFEQPNQTFSSLAKLQASKHYFWAVICSLFAMERMSSFRFGKNGAENNTKKLNSFRVWISKKGWI